MGIQNGVIGYGVMMSALALVSGDKLVQPLVVKGPPALKMHGNVNTPRSAKSKKEVTILLGPQQAENIDQNAFNFYSQPIDSNFNMMIDDKSK